MAHGKQNQSDRYCVQGSDGLFYSISYARQNPEEMTSDALAEYFETSDPEEVNMDDHDRQMRRYESSNWWDKI